MHQKIVSHLPIIFIKYILCLFSVLTFNKFLLLEPQIDKIENNVIENHIAQVLSYIRSLKLIGTNHCL